MKKGLRRTPNSKQEVNAVDEKENGTAYGPGLYKKIPWEDYNHSIYHKSHVQHTHGRLQRHHPMRAGSQRQFRSLSKKAFQGQHWKAQANALKDPGECMFEREYLCPVCTWKIEGDIRHYGAGVKGVLKQLGLGFGN
ncbi:hypothetical protein STEG23_026236 [Scotinomys teguina]